MQKSKTEFSFICYIYKLKTLRGYITGRLSITGTPTLHIINIPIHEIQLKKILIVKK